MSFVHLHVHTEYSLLDGCNRVGPMVARAKELGMPAIALTDHGVMFGAVNFYNACRAAGIKPLVGCEVYVAPRGRKDKESGIDSRPYHLTLLVKDRQGYSNLTQLVSAAYLEGFYYKPRIDHELLSQHHEGLVCLTGCLRGEVNDALLADDYPLAKERLQFLHGLFGEDLFVELMNHGLPEQAKTNPLLIQLAKELGILTVATNDAHYLNREDASIQDILICVATGKLLSDENRLKMSCDEFYIKSREEMLQVFDFCPEAVDNTLKVAERCDFEMDFDTIYLPKFPVPNGQTSDEFLKELCQKGLMERFGTLNPGPEYLERLDKELDIIIGKGFPDYFLLVWDFINWSQRHGIPVGPGRGSAAGSLVAYLIGITQLDPLPHDLLFERFLNPERTELPDIDTDFCVERRGEVIQYCRERYGNDRVAQIATFGRMKAKNALRDVGRVMGIPLADVNRLTKAVPNDLKMTLALAMEAPAFRELYDSSEVYRKLVEQAMRCEGIIRNSGIHAAGVIISSRPLGQLVPLFKGPKDEVVVQYDMSDSSSVGMVKMDFLGLRNLTIIDDCVKIIKYSRGEDVDLSKLIFDDPATYQLLCEADTNGVFQLESDGMKRYLKQLKPDRFSDIVAFLALYRPGPIKGGVVDDFIARRHGKGGALVYPHPKLEPILKDSYGFFLYQEQVMLTAAVLAGYSMAMADKLRKAMGKKKADVMEKHRHIFVDGAVERGVDKKVAADIFLTMENFAAYGFNKSHSAAYAVVSYHTAYLKAHYRPEYMAAIMTSVISSIDRVSFFIRECRQSGVEVLGPDVNESMARFSVSNQAVRWGLAAVRNVGLSAVDYMVKERQANGRFVDLADFCSRVDFGQVNKKVLEALIKSGAMDCFGQTRATLLANLDGLVDYGMFQKKERQSGQSGLFDDVEEEKITTDDLLPNREEEFAPRTLLDFEKEMLGVFLSGSPLTEFKDILATTTRIANLAALGPNTKVTIGGYITSCRTVTTRFKTNMAFLQVEDATGSVEVIVRPQVYSSFESLCEDGKVILINGTTEAALARRKQTISVNSEDNEEESASETEEEADEEEEEFKVTADEVISADVVAKRKRSGQERNKALLDRFRGLNVELQAYQQEQLSALRNLLIRNKGHDCMVYLHLKSPDKTTVVLLNKDFMVNDSKQLHDEIEHLLGENSCRTV